MVEDKTLDEKIFDGPNGLRHNLPTLLASSLAEALVRAEDVELHLKTEMAASFWRALQRTASEWNLENLFRDLSREEAVRATNILMENYHYLFIEAPSGILVVCPSCRFFSICDVTLQELLKMDPWVCPACGKAHRISEVIRKGGGDDLLRKEL